MRSDHSALSTESSSVVNEPIPSQLSVASDHSSLSTESISNMDELIPSELSTTTLRRFNVFLVFIPLSWAIHFTLPDQHTLIFVSSFLAIISLDKLRAYATDDLSIRVGQTLAGLLNATLENVVELIVSPSQNANSIVQSSFLVLGMCFFAGGMRFSEQGFGLGTMQLNSSLLTISAIAILLPGAFHMALQGYPSYSELSTNYSILRISHGLAIILLFIYSSYLVVQLFSHKALYDGNNADIQKTKGYEGHNPWLQLRLYRRKAAKPIVSPEPMDDEEAIIDTTGFASTEDADSEVETYMSVPVALGLLVVVTALIAATAEFLVDSINGLNESQVISKEFIAVILLPIVGNVTSVTAAFKGHITLSLGVAVGSSIQVALFVAPFIVTLAWTMGKPLTFLFDPLESIVLFVSVLTVNYVIQDGKSNWLEGMILMGLYLILAVTFWFYPGTSLSEMMFVGC
ncbi:uncharacterized protein BJ212DRAFT_1300592 [Suillus subaureus]|uniref:Sodium/calcium exchanger membrane region domain-containing protein n=1 Tax=Suillus subaureus TaxID=48587 RepID=A0A9P7E8G4_9AGAM|nr:uncharacterized protein BJ212DRAFT_1300592 [Suillus subaureus]KAG1814270.1 hypothetical protein BJ212DRAFT_1300592 [Suillus subaureus]